MADRAQKSGIAAEAQQKIYSKFEPPLAHEILAWISNLTNEPINTSGEPENFTDVLQDGLVLCKLANTLSPGSVKKVNTSSMAFKKMENISFFLNFAVLVCLSALARKSQKAFGKPGLGPKESEGEKRQFSEEVLRGGDSVIGLQMGSNKGASQSGMIMGNTRHM
ncbi:calponin homology (CH) domain-containing protein [Ditylenchus destructor]|nr:calponin homology (CH) domain-containing protein [Ditylenchus destructor]